MDLLSFCRRALPPNLAKLLSITLVCSAFAAAPASAESAAQDIRSFTLRIGSYNVHGLPSPVITNKGRYKEIGRRLASLRKQGRAPQILVIQEAFDRGTKAIASESGYPYVAFGPRPWLMHIGSGLLVLSEFPITQAQTMKYHSCASWDCVASKGAIHALIHVPGVPYPIDLFDTHLNSDPDTDPITSVAHTRKVRMKQLKALGEFMTKVATPAAFLFAPADYNFFTGDTDEKYWASLSRSTDAAEECRAQPDACKTSEDLQAQAQSSVDHVFASARASGARATPIRYARTFREPFNGKQLSDHLALEVTYRLDW